MSASRVTKLGTKAAFLHVIDPHRWLAASGCAWNLVGANAANGAKDEAHRLIPNIDVFVRDCLLLHARLLMKFYTSDGHGTDILLSAFGVPPIEPLLTQDLKKYEKPIEVHLLHMTDWRDSNYRKSDAKRYRPDWNTEIPLIVDLVFKSLKYVSEQSGPWQPAFKSLNDASTARYRNAMHPWPKNLCEKDDVEKYLTGIGV